MTAHDLMDKLALARVSFDSGRIEDCIEQLTEYQRMREEFQKCAMDRVRRLLTIGVDDGRSQPIR